MSWLGKCDLCGEDLLEADAKIVPPSEMRVIAGNGYGDRLKVWPDLELNERQVKLYQMAIFNETDWAVCPTCFMESRGFSIDLGEGMSHEEFRKTALEMLSSCGTSALDQPSSGECEETSFDQAGKSVLDLPPASRDTKGGYEMSAYSSEQARNLLKSFIVGAITEEKFRLELKSMGVPQSGIDTMIGDASLMRAAHLQSPSRETNAVTHSIPRQGGRSAIGWIIIFVLLTSAAAYYFLGR